MLTPTEAEAAKGVATSHGVLDAVGRSFLTVDYRWYGMAIVLVIALYFYRSRAGERDESAVITDILALVAALLTLVGGLDLLAVFVLTRPPAIELIDPNQLMGIGIVSGIIMLYQAWRQLAKLFAPAAGKLGKEPS